MNQKKITIIAGAVIIVSLVGLGIFLALSGDRDDQSGTEMTGSSQGAEPNEADHDDQSHGHEIDVSAGDNETEATRTYRAYGQTLLPDYINQNIAPSAHTAAREYVRQSTAETDTERQARLARVFTPGSRAITAPKPAVDKTYSPNTASNPVQVHSEWSVSGDRVVVTVFFDIITTSTEQVGREVSRVTQGYDVTMVPHEGGYRAQSISFSNRPLIRPR